MHYINLSDVISDAWYENSYKLSSRALKLTHNCAQHLSLMKLILRVKRQQANDN
jgi:hypothetical protein